jgi:prepilin-type N-terminal cleavage/methylation domain-containing protein
MSHSQPKRRSSAGFTLIEMLTATAIIGVLASTAIPVFMDYIVVAKVTEGVLLLSELRRRVEVGFNEQGSLDSVIPASPAADGQLHGDPFYTYETLFGTSHNMWQQIEYQPKGPNRVIALRAHRKPEWDNSDIGIHLQIKLNGDNTLSFRCTVNNQLTRMRFVPSTCRDGDANDWTSW